jgi:transposase InsO family protein
MIAAARAAHPALSVRRLCALLGVNRAWYYQQQREGLVLAFPGDGSRRVTRALQREGWDVNHERVRRVMRREALLCQLKRRCVAPTDARHGCRTYPNLLRETVVDRLDQVWLADITYIRLPTIFVYLAGLLDAFSRRCVGWHLSRAIGTGLTLAALDRAPAGRRPTAGLIHHSDQGVQYASAACVARLAEAGARLSMAAVGNPYENARAERFFTTVKREEVYLKDHRTFAAAQTDLVRFSDDVYNTKRSHSSLGYRPPAEFEAARPATGVG